MSERVRRRVEELLRRHRLEGPNWMRHEYALEAVCLTGRHVLAAGYGRAGVGRIWRDVSRKDGEDELWAELPRVQCVSFSIDRPCPPGPHDPRELVLLNGREEVLAEREAQRRGQT